MSKSRAQTRHHKQRVKDKRKSYVNMYREPTSAVKEPTDKQIGKVAHTPTNCSCWMCGNPRKYFDQITLKEKSFIELEKHDA